MMTSEEGTVDLLDNGGNVESSSEDGKITETSDTVSSMLLECHQGLISSFERLAMTPRLSTEDNEAISTTIKIIEADFARLTIAIKKILTLDEQSVWHRSQCAHMVAYLSAVDANRRCIKQNGERGILVPVPRLSDGKLTPSAEKPIACIKAISALSNCQLTDWHNLYTSEERSAFRCDRYECIAFLTAYLTTRNLVALNKWQQEMRQSV